MSAEEVAKAFVGHFYQAFDSNAQGLAGLYVSDDLDFSLMGLRILGGVCRWQLRVYRDDLDF